MAKYELRLPHGLLSASGYRHLCAQISIENEYWRFLTQTQTRDISGQDHGFSWQSEAAHTTVSMGRFWDAFENELKALGAKALAEKFGDLKARIEGDRYLPPLSSSRIAVICKELYDADRRPDAIAILIGSTGSRFVGSGPNGNAHYEWSAYTGFSRAIALATETQDFNRDGKTELAEIRREENLARAIARDMGVELLALENQRADNQKKAERELEESRKRLNRARKLAVTRLWNWRKASRSAAAQQGRDFKALQDAFSAHLRLKRPVELWQERRDEHASAAKKAWCVFLIVAIVFSFISIFTAVKFGSDIAAAFVKDGCRFGFEASCKGISPRGPLTISSLLLVSTIVLWFLRFQMRIYLSERHLTLDARERMAFAETYLALLRGADVTNEHEVVILQSLFRPTQDGIIRDDLGPDIGIASMAARTLDSKKM